MCSKTLENKTVIIACHNDYICVDQNCSTANARDVEHVLVLERRMGGSEVRRSVVRVINAALVARTAHTLRCISQVHCLMVSLWASSYSASSGFISGHCGRRLA